MHKSSKASGNENKIKQKIKTEKAWYKTRKNRRRNKKRYEMKREIIVTMTIKATNEKLA